MFVVGVQPARVIDCCEVVVLREVAAWWHGAEGYCFAGGVH